MAGKNIDEKRRFADQRQRQRKADQRDAASGIVKITRQQRPQRGRRHDQEGLTAHPETESGQNRHMQPGQRDQKTRNPPLKLIEAGHTDFP
jgi:hypothetical protein